MSGKVGEFFKMLMEPKLVVNLMFGSVDGKDAFYARVTTDFYREARQRHPKFPLLRRLQYGVALCRLPSKFEEYFRMVESAARRNFKKAERNGYRIQVINFNDYLNDIASIRSSAKVRQGVMSEDYFSDTVQSCMDPPSKTITHDYIHYGVIKEGKLVAYAGVLVAGELAMVEHILGHAAFQSDGVVPMLIIGMTKCLLENYPSVNYYGYGSYFGSGETMRRFKRKFCFTPHRVKWVLG